MKIPVTITNPEPNFLNNLLNGPKPFEKIISAWMTTVCHTIAIGPDDIENPSCNIIMLIDNNEVKAGAELDLSLLKKNYKKIDCYIPPQTIADTGNLRVPYEDIIDHRAKYGVRRDTHTNKNIMNPSFIGNLCMSYLTEYRGTIKISLETFEDERFYPRYHCTIQIAHLQELPIIENYSVLTDRLDNYAARGK